MGLGARCHKQIRYRAVAAARRDQCFELKGERQSLYESSNQVGTVEDIGAGDVLYRMICRVVLSQAVSETASYTGN